ncbi:uncharacterized protein [Tursiops truncatus]|uniref:uncharacterized protein isoform X2 n=1 Tax=Tursiops truncatus TaxID=9739 RepID=UPI003CCFD59C
MEASQSGVDLSVPSRGKPGRPLGPGRGRPHPWGKGGDVGSGRGRGRGWPGRGRALRAPIGYGPLHTRAPPISPRQQSVPVPAAAAAPSPPRHPADPCSGLAWRPRPRSPQRASWTPSPGGVVPVRDPWLESGSPRRKDARTVPQEPDPFYYDYDTVQTVGMTLATILFLLGILIIISKKMKCRKADSSPTCKSSPQWPPSLSEPLKLPFPPSAPPPPAAPSLLIPRPQSRPLPRSPSLPTGAPPRPDLPALLFPTPTLP